MIKEAAKLIKNSKYLLITAGAGIGVDSGLPDFRGNKGFWKAYPIAKKLGLNFQALANPSWFDINPKLAWAFYGDRFNLYKNTTPHPGFDILLNLPNNKFVVTSNVDGQFQKAGFSELRVVEIHGSINYLQCSEPCCNNIWSNEFKFEIDMDKFEAKTYPMCKYCKKVARPNILMFSDFKFISKRVDLQLARFEYWLSQIDDDLVILEIGAGKAVPTIRRLSEEIKRKFNTKLIRINPVDFDGADIAIKKGALEALEELSKYI